MPPSKGNEFFSGILLVDRSHINLILGEDNDKLKKGWRSFRGTVIDNITADGSLLLYKDSRNSLDIAAPVEPSSWFYRIHGDNKRADDITFVFIGIADDRHKEHTEHARSLQIGRLSDNKTGLISDEWIVQAILDNANNVSPFWVIGAGPVAVVPAGPGPHTRVAPPQSDGKPERVVMTHLARFDVRESTDKYVDHLYQGGRSLDRAGRTDEKLSPPGGGLIGRRAHVLVNVTQSIHGKTADGTNWTDTCVRDDAKFARRGVGAAKVGRLYITDDPPGTRPEGLRIDGVLFYDPALANADTDIGRETGEIPPQMRLPVLYGLPWTEPAPWGDGGVVGFVMPQTYTVGRFQVVGFQDGVDEMLSGEGYYKPANMIDKNVVPLEMVGTFVTLIPVGEAVAAATAVMRYIVYVFDGDDTADVSHHTRYGEFVIDVAAEEGVNNIEVVANQAWHADELNPRDTVLVKLWRDYADPRDDFLHKLYVKEVQGLIGQTVIEGHYFNSYYMDQTITADDTVISDPYVA